MFQNSTPLPPSARNEAKLFSWIMRAKGKGGVNPVQECRFVKYKISLMKEISKFLPSFSDNCVKIPASPSYHVR